MNEAAMEQATHRCAVGDCHTQVPREQLMCARHWRLVPASLKRALHRAWHGGSGSREHQAAMHACVEAVQASCQPASDPQLRRMVRSFLAGYRHPNAINGEGWDEDDVSRLIRAMGLPPPQARPPNTTLPVLRRHRRNVTARHQPAETPTVSVSCDCQLSTRGEPWCETSPPPPCPGT